MISIREWCLSEINELDRLLSELHSAGVIDCINLESWRQEAIQELNKLDSNSFLSPAIEIANLVYQKNLQYGNSFERAKDIMDVLYPDGISNDQ